MIEVSSIRVLDDTLWYYGGFNNTAKMSDVMWASRIMAIHFFKTEEAKESLKQSRKYK